MGRQKIDLTGQIFGYLTVIEEDIEKEKQRVLEGKKKQIYWKCKCSCGNFTSVSGKHLRDGTTKSCGCLAKEKLKTSGACVASNLIGKVYGRLTVIARDYETPKTKKKNDTYWICECSCEEHNIISVCGQRLKNSYTRSCGCLVKETCRENSGIKLESGSKFGKLTVLEMDNNFHKDKKLHYWCLCDCGNRISISASHIKNGHTKSCGCLLSWGEEQITKYLNQKHINFIKQYNEEKMILSSGYKPRYDFAILNNEKQVIFLLEYNGSQHYFYTNSGWNTEERFNQTIKNDKEKEAIAKSFNYPLEIIRYDENIEERLNELLVKYNLM